MGRSLCLKDGAFEGEMLSSALGGIDIFPLPFPLPFPFIPMSLLFLLFALFVANFSAKEVTSSSCSSLRPRRRLDTHRAGPIHIARRHRIRFLHFVMVVSRCDDNPMLRQYSTTSRVPKS